ncbi:MFS transporter [Vulcanisaeta distributa]|uniref:Major facilitator superfamily MFS_1 n=1 Tax=Vulcanisaeta distributa (strain DSM 14429 / JCM 11212 / NBRC 100878 / IC-017) TaxID=572478 RepID=E1QRU0_VULDI|nr:MFS transporter [Vulcanisaeta distributa]ADN49465.1 major facilitator superfamily MFS_1 [Vulcanisaeta distributa DSM 14429]
MERGLTIVLIASLAFFSVVLVRFSIPSLLPYLIGLNGINTVMGGLIISALWVGYTIFQVIGGLIVDKYGYNVVIYVLILISIINVLYPIIINQYYLLLIVQFIMGSLLAIAYVALISMVLSNYSRGGLGAGIYQSMFFLASSVSIMISPLLFSINRFIPFIAYSIIVISSIIPVAKVPRRGRVGGTIYIGPGNLRILGMGFIRLSSGFSYLGFLSWSTYYVVHVLKVSPSFSGFYAFLASIMGSVGAVIGGYLGDRVGYALPSILSSLLLAIIVSVIPRLSILYLLAFLMLLLGFFYGFYAAPSIAISRLTTNIGATSGFLNFMSQLGGSISPYVIGFLLQYYDFPETLLIIGIASAALVIIGATLLFYKRIT